VVHAGLTTPPGWRVFAKFCRGELALPSLTDRQVLGQAISLMGRV
jgi:hypothetical protein